jgi:gliding motility-associated-like protein
LNKVTVNKDQSVEISIVSDSSDVSYYEVYRSNFSGIQPVKIGETDSVISPNSFIDPFIYPDINTYYYSALAVDRCNNRIRRTEPNSIDTSVVHNLRLQTDFSDFKEIDLRWGNYDGFLNSDVIHELWKDVNGSQELIYEVQPNSQTSVEIVNDIGKICFFVKAYEQDFNIIGRQDTIYSNSICINNIPKIYIPSAFTPNDDFKNNIFKTEIYDNGSLESFSLKIYDLFSKLVFQSNDENIHWDGKFNNRDLPIDTYIYFMELTYGGGQIVTKNGNITLLR